jgi:predicted ATPase
MDSPQGLLLHGEVGTGKSFLVDLLADSLPNRKKRRWHFNTFMLETFARLDQLRQSRSSPLASADAEHSLIWLAKDMIEHSPVLFLDEFQLPDRAASKILSNLFTVFFQLGGVLVATSNRMPDELAKASGMDFVVPQRGGMVKNWLGLGNKAKLDMFPSHNEYAGFVEVLKARCEIWNMEGGRDWRRREAEEMDEEAIQIAETMREDMVGDLRKFEDLKPLFGQANGHGFSVNMAKIKDETRLVPGITPKKYVLASPGSEATWEATIRNSLPSNTPTSIPWQSTVLQVYGRKIPVPRQLEGVTHWTFPQLCMSCFGPADCKSKLSQDEPCLKTYLSRSSPLL